MRTGGGGRGAVSDSESEGDYVELREVRTAVGRGLDKYSATEWGSGIWVGERVGDAVAREWRVGKGDIGRAEGKRGGWVVVAWTGGWKAGDGRRTG